jgi:hypothetical protein
VKGRAHHLQEERLFDCYLAEYHGELVDPPAAEHLVDCADCAERYGELVRFMTDLRSEADGELDALFTPEQLAAQKQSIARRLEHLGHAARVISFPGRVMGKPSASTQRTTPRWAAAAAAAGLFVGVSAGMFVDRATGRSPAAAPPQASARLAPAPVAIPSAAPVPDDDTFLWEIEVALGGPRNRELAPFDVLTPRIQETSLVR